MKSHYAAMTALTISAAGLSAVSCAPNTPPPCEQFTANPTPFIHVIAYFPCDGRPVYGRGPRYIPQADPEIGPKHIPVPGMVLPDPLRLKLT